MNKAILGGVCALLLLLLLFGACSRPVKVKEAPAKASADATLKLAQNLEQKQRNTDSVATYASALRQYRSIGDLRGEEFALAGLARLAYLAGDEESFTSYRQDLVNLVADADPEGAFVPLLLDIHLLLDAGDYARIKELAVDSYDYPISVRVQVLTQALQADSWLKPGFSSVAFSDLERLSKRYRRSMKKDFSADSSVLSAALYAMSYHSFLLKDYGAAQKYVAEAEILDYRSENFPALAYDLWLKAKILEADGSKALALSEYTRALHIFSQYANNEMQSKTEAAIQRLKGE
ncbi:MAG: hypothetical protein M0R50_01150 [Candidatus Cloacimonetes bacterium]|nr:hypothetical protein [Candidatus Cloacimonadota bacterium]